MTQKRRRFFSFFINRPAQRQFVLMQFFMLSSIMLFLLYGSFQLFQDFSETGKNLVLTGEELKMHLKALYQGLYVRLFLVFLVGFTVNILFGILFLHRMTGPLVQVNRALQTLAQGNFPDGSVRFRKDDFTPELAESMNNLINFLKRKSID